MSRGHSTSQRRRYQKTTAAGGTAKRIKASREYYKAPSLAKPEINEIELASFPFRETNPDRTEGAKKLGFLEA
jgi:hypothetical protein